jgi:hypothetical protein
MLSPLPSSEAIREADRLFWLQVIAEMNLKPGITGVSSSSDYPRTAWEVRNVLR